MPRTGTASLRLALSLLLDGPIYHMYQVIEKGTKEDVEFWSQACDKEKTSKTSKLLFGRRRVKTCRKINKF